MKSKFLGIVCLLYSGIIMYIWFTDKLKLFLAPNMQIYIKLSLVPIIVMGLVILFNHINYKFKFSDIILLLPLVMIFISGDGVLTTSLAKNKSNIISTHKKEEKKEEKKEDKKEEKLEEKKDNSDYDFSNPFFDITDDVYADVSGYMSSAPNNDKFIGKTIRVRGFAVKYETFLPDGYFALGKYVITCCAADSSFTGFIFKYESYKIKNNHWYEIEGVLKEDYDKEGYKMLYVDVINIKEIDSSSEEQYIYPCYAYDDTCSQLKKYDLVF